MLSRFYFTSVFSNARNASLFYNASFVFGGRAQSCTVRLFIILFR